MESKLDRGYLVLADITGFTPFVAGTELEHSQAILGEIFSVIINGFNPSLEIAEVEGDAVFAYASHERLQRGELLLEIVEATYVDFRNMQASAKRTATCKCKACEQSSHLDLKFITHYGDFVLQDISGKKKPLGSSVNLLHRLAKNKVCENTGWRGYALFTEASLTKMDIHLTNIHTQAENYEHLGDVQTFSMNLDERYKALTDERNVVVYRERAHVVMIREFHVSPSVLWDWLNDPDKRRRWMLNNDWQVGGRPAGRLSRGATNHCASSGFIEVILDWRPFSYYTVQIMRRPIRLLVTTTLEASEKGTRLLWYGRLDGSLPNWLRRPMCRLLVAKGAKTKESFSVLARVLERERKPELVQS